MSLTFRANTLLAACLALLGGGVSRAQQPLPPLSDSMYNDRLPAVVIAPRWPTLCPPLPRDRVVRPPTRDGPLECPEHYESIAFDVWRTMDSTTDSEVRARAADILGQLWTAHRLPAEIKSFIVDRHLAVRLTQQPSPSGGLELEVSGDESFKFAPVTFTIRSTVYRNNDVIFLAVQTRGRAPLEAPVSLAGLGTGRYTIGDVYTFDIILDEENDNDIVWRKVLRTNAVAVK